MPEIGSYTLTEEDRPKSHETARTEAASRGVDDQSLKRQLLEEDILILWGRGMVPLAIAGKLRIPGTRVSEVVREEEHEISSYVTTSGPTPETHVCPRCGQSL